VLVWRQGRPALFLTDYDESFIDEYSHQPISEGTSRFDTFEITKSLQQAVLHGILGFLVVAEDAMGQAVKQSPIPRK
jgi:hypothetical protein